MASPATEAPATGENKLAWRPVVEVVLAQTALLGAVAYFVGHTYNEGYYGYLALPQQLFDVKVYDILLRGGQYAFAFFGIVLVGAVFLAAAMISLATWLGDTAERYRLATVVCLSLFLGGAAIDLWLWSRRDAVVASIGMLVVTAVATQFALVVIAYGGTSAELRRYWRLGLAGCAGAAILVSINLLGEIARTDGADDAKAAYESLGKLSSVNISSDHDLFLAGDGIRVASNRSPDGSTQYHYEGLKLLAYNGTVFIVVGSTWSSGETVFIITQDPGIRVDIRKM